MTDENNIMLHPDEIKMEFIRSSGPGGQNVNKVATAVQLRFDVDNSPSLTDTVKHRLKQLAGKRITADGVLIIEAKRYRTQEQNRKDALERLARLVEKAHEQPKARKKTKPSAAAKKRRLEAKRLLGKKKRERSKKNFHLE